MTTPGNHGSEGQVQVASYERVVSTYARVEEKGDDNVQELGELLGAQRVHDLDVRRQLGVDLLLAAHEASHWSAVGKRSGVEVWSSVKSLFGNGF